MLSSVCEDWFTFTITIFTFTITLDPVSQFARVFVFSLIFDKREEQCDVVNDAKLIPFFFQNSALGLISPISSKIAVGVN